MSKIGRNDPCPCKSGKKYKKCCETADKIQRSQENNPLQTEQLPPGHQIYNMVVAIKPRPRKPQRRTPGQIARSGKMPRLTNDEFPGEHLAQSFMGAFQKILHTIEQANDQLEKSGHISAITTTLIVLDRPKNRIHETAYETVAKPFALLRAVTDSIHASTLDQHVRAKLNDEPLALYNQLTQQRFEPWTFDPSQDDYLIAHHITLSTGQMTETEIDGFFSISDHLPSVLHVAMPLEWNGHNILLGLGSLYDAPNALPYLLNAIASPTNAKSPERIIEDALLRYLLDPTPYLSNFADTNHNTNDDDDDDDDYDAYPEYRPDIYDILINILTYLHPIDPPEYEEYYIHETFKEMIEIYTPKQLKTFQQHVEEDYETTLNDDFDDPYDDFRETLPLSEIHELLGSDANQAIASLKTVKQQPAALLLADDLLKTLAVDRLDTIQTVEKAALAQKDNDIATRAQNAIHRYMRNVRMTSLLGFHPGQIHQEESTTWAQDHTYDLIMDCADEHFKSIPLTQLPLTNAVINRITKAFRPDATIADLPALKNDLHTNIKGIGPATANALLSAINELFSQWPYTLAGIDPNVSTPKSQSKSKDMAKTQKALKDLGKLFE